MSLTTIYLLNPELQIHQIKDAILERLHQLLALTSLCQEEEFKDYISDYLNNYFWLEHTLVNQIIELFYAYDKRMAN